MYKKLTTHRDERGFFREIIRQSDEIFDQAHFAQLSHSMKYAGYYTEEFHYHRWQTDWWYVPVGIMRVVLCPLENIAGYTKRAGNYTELITTSELVIRIPPMTAHGLKVLEGPAHLIYITSQVYNPDDEGRIELDYDWSR